MTFSKEVSFPYPVLSLFTDDYDKSEFVFEINVIDSELDYIFKLDIKLKSEFLKNQLSNQKARLILLIESKDGKFFELNYYAPEISIKKSRISLNKRTCFQLAVISNEQISFQNNNELSVDYLRYKNEITIDKNCILALSNVERFDGDTNKPFELIKYQIIDIQDEDLIIDIEREYVVLKFNNKEMLYDGYKNKNHFCYHYVYLGLQKALLSMVISDKYRDIMTLDDDYYDENALHRKIYRFLKIKKVKSLDFDNVDEVISLISDGILRKHYRAVKGAINSNDN